MAGWLDGWLDGWDLWIGGWIANSRAALHCRKTEAPCARHWVASVLTNSIIVLNKTQRGREEECMCLCIYLFIYFPTCQVRVVRFYVSCLLLSSSPLLLLLLNRDPRRTVFSVGPQPRPSTPSVPCRTSTTTIPAQCSLPDLNHDHPRPVFPAGPQPRVSTPSVPCRTSCRKIERMSDKYVIYYLQTRACVVEWPGQCHFLLCRWQSLKQSVWTDDRVTGVDRDISTSVPLELFAKTLETGNILQQVTTNYLKWSHAGLMLETVNITQGFCCVSQLWWHGGYVTSEHLLEHLSPHLLDRGPEAGWTSS